jgi:hypothetical protein
MEVAQSATSTQVNNISSNNAEATTTTTTAATLTPHVVILDDKLCEIEAAILRSNEIIDCNETDKIKRPVCEFTITEDDLVPELLFKKFARNLEKIQSLASKYLKSKTPAPQLRVSHKPPIPRRARST